MRGIGLVFRSQIEDILDVVARYQRWFTLGSLALVLPYVVTRSSGGEDWSAASSRSRTSSATVDSP